MIRCAKMTSSRRLVGIGLSWTSVERYLADHEFDVNLSYHADILNLRSLGHEVYVTDNENNIIEEFDTIKWATGIYTNNPDLYLSLSMSNPNDELLFALKYAISDS